MPRTTKKRTAQVEASTSSTPRVRLFRKERRKEGGSPLSGYLRQPAAVALNLLQGLPSKTKVATIEAALLAQARSHAPTVERTLQMLADGRIDHKTSEHWISFLQLDMTQNESSEAICAPSRASTE